MDIADFNKEVELLGIAVQAMKSLSAAHTAYEAACSDRSIIDVAENACEYAEALAASTVNHILQLWQDNTKDKCVPMLSTNDIDNIAFINFLTPCAEEYEQVKRSLGIDDDREYTDGNFERDYVQYLLNCQSGEYMQVTEVQGDLKNGFKQFRLTLPTSTT